MFEEQHLFLAAITPNNANKKIQKVNIA